MQLLFAHRRPSGLVACEKIAETAQNEEDLEAVMLVF